MPYLCKGIIMHYNTLYLLMTNSFKHLAQSIWFIFGFLSVNNSWNVPEITHCCFPHVNNAHAVYLRLCSVCFSPSAHPSSIPLSSNLKTCQNCLLPSSLSLSLSLSLSFRVAVTSFGREMDSAQFRFCSVSSLRQSDYQSASAKQTYTHTHSMKPLCFSMRGLIVNIWDLVEIRTTYSSLVSPNHKLI